MIIKCKQTVIDGEQYPHWRATATTEDGLFTFVGFGMYEVWAIENAVCQYDAHHRRLMDTGQQHAPDPIPEPPPSDEDTAPFEPVAAVCQRCNGTGRIRHAVGNHEPCSCAEGKRLQSYYDPTQSYGSPDETDRLEAAGREWDRQEQSHDNPFQYGPRSYDDRLSMCYSSQLI